MKEHRESLMIWADHRFLRPRACGFLPLIGYVDALPFSGPRAIYAGEFDPAIGHFREHLIQEQSSDTLY